MNAARLWKLMTAEQRRRASAALWAAQEAANDQAQAVMLIARQMKMRPKSAVGLDADRKVRYLASVPDVPESLAASLLVAYHIAEQRPMMGAFLDALGITHENGLIHEGATAPDAARIPAAAATVAKTYPSEDVALYFNTLVSQDPLTWGALESIVEKGPR
jgi:hypothetical protein